VFLEGKLTIKGFDEGYQDPVEVLGVEDQAINMVRIP